MEQLFKMTNKTNLRKWAKTFDKSQYSAKFVELIRKTDEYKQAKNIMIFYPLKNEVNLLSLLEDKEKKFFLPKIDGDNLLCCSFDESQELCTSCFKTKEPTTPPCDKNCIDLVIVPALCCDKNNFRLGYGGGFYDRFLIDFKGNSIVCLPKSLIIETIYPEKYDIPINTIISC